MRPRDLFKAWHAPDSAQLTARQFSIRLPVHVAAKIAALCEMYPKKTRTDIIGDLLSSALVKIEAGLPTIQGEEMHGYDRTRFRTLAARYLREFGAEPGRQRNSKFSRTYKESS
ncbi:MAG TPA: hypothetical protein VE398_14160 [Acidobacteriota bacterium]|jgi:hypothetical protein|nr:hypothetical protein [Acidobacteriota bacterium]